MYRSIVIFITVYRQYTQFVVSTTRYHILPFVATATHLSFFDILLVVLYNVRARVRVSYNYMAIYCIYSGNLFNIYTCTFYPCFCNFCTCTVGAPTFIIRLQSNTGNKQNSPRLTIHHNTHTRKEVNNYDYQLYQRYHRRQRRK